MSGSIQNIVGKSTEERISKSFRDHRYWAYVLPKKVGGQPFDVIGCRRNIIWFVDAKHLEKEKASFSFERIEPNQKTAMTYASTFAEITNLGFVIEWDRNPETLYFFSFEKYVEMEKSGEKSVKIETLENFGELL